MECMRSGLRRNDSGIAIGYSTFVDGNLRLVGRTKLDNICRGTSATTQRMWLEKPGRLVIPIHNWLVDFCSQTSQGVSAARSKWKASPSDASDECDTNWRADFAVRCQLPTKC